MHDDDVLQLATFTGGTLADKYVSCPAIHDQTADPRPVGGDAEALVALTGSGDPDIVDRLLRDDFDFESERHDALLSELDLPSEAAGWGFHYIEQGDGPQDIIRVNVTQNG